MSGGFSNSSGSDFNDPNPSYNPSFAPIQNANYNPTMPIPSQPPQYVSGLVYQMQTQQPMYGMQGQNYYPGQGSTPPTAVAVVPLRQTSTPPTAALVSGPSGSFSTAPAPAYVHPHPIPYSRPTSAPVSAWAPVHTSAPVGMKLNSSYDPYRQGYHLKKDSVDENRNEILIKEAEEKRKAAAKGADKGVDKYGAKPADKYVDKYADKPAADKYVDKYSKPEDLKRALGKLKGLEIKPKQKPKAGALVTQPPPRLDATVLKPLERNSLVGALGNEPADSKEDSKSSLLWGWVFLEMISLLKPDSLWRQAVWDNYSTSFAMTMTFAKEENLAFTSHMLPLVMKAVVSESGEELAALLYRYPTFLTETALTNLAANKEDPVRETVKAVFEADVNGFLVPQAMTILKHGIASGDDARVFLCQAIFLGYLKQETTAFECLKQNDSFLLELIRGINFSKLEPKTATAALGLLALVAKTCNGLLTGAPLYKEVLDKVLNLFADFAQNISRIYEEIKVRNEPEVFLLVFVLLKVEIQDYPESIAQYSFIANNLEYISIQQPAIFERLRQIIISRKLSEK